MKILLITSAVVLAVLSLAFVFGVRYAGRQLQTLGGHRSLLTPGTRHEKKCDLLEQAAKTSTDNTHSTGSTQKIKEILSFLIFCGSAAAVFTVFGIGLLG